MLKFFFNNRKPHWILAILAILVSSVFAQDEVPDVNYWRLQEIKDQFQSWETEYPDLCHQMILGQSGLKENIPMIRISDNATMDESEPSLYFQGALHSNEPNGTTAIMKSIAALLEGYGVDAAVTARVDSLALYFVPILNVDGHNHVFSGSLSWKDWRKTLRDNNGNGIIDFPGDGVDLNRNWDWNWDIYGGDDPESVKYKGPYPFSESEALAVRDFMQSEKPVVVVDYHSPVTIAYRKCIFWPWRDPVNGQNGPDADVARDIACLWAGATIDLAGTAYNNLMGYTTLPKVQNWVYGKLGILAYTMEISDQCWWSGADVDTIGVRVARGSEVLLDRVLYGPGIRGTVTNFADGNPLVAEVIINEMHSDSLGVRLTDADYGSFYRLTRSGDFTVSVHCAGFESQEKSVKVCDGWQQLDFSLHEDVSAAGSIETINWFRTTQVIGSQRGLMLDLPSGLPDATVELFDLRGRRVGILGQNLPSGHSHELMLPQAISGGMYLVRIKAGNRVQTGRVTVVP